MFASDLHKSCFSNARAPQEQRKPGNAKNETRTKCVSVCSVCMQHCGSIKMPLATLLYLRFFPKQTFTLPYLFFFFFHFLLCVYTFQPLLLAFLMLLLHPCCFYKLFVYYILDLKSTNYWFMLHIFEQKRQGA